MGRSTARRMQTPRVRREVGNCTFSRGPSTACDYRLCPTSSRGPPPRSAAGFPSRPRGTRPRNRASSGGSALTRTSSVHSPADCLEVSDRTVPTAALPGSLCRLSGLRIGGTGWGSWAAAGGWGARTPRSRASAHPGRGRQGSTLGAQGRPDPREFHGLWTEAGRSGVDASGLTVTSGL